MNTQFLEMKTFAQLQRLKYEDHVRYFREQLQIENKKLIKRPKQIQAMQKKIQALEGGRDVLTTYITDLERTEKLVDKNNYITYSAQVTAAYDMYAGIVDNGTEIFGAVTDSRVACIGGEGINFKSENKAKEKFIKNFLKMNKLQGSNLLAFLLTGELEGKNLLILNLIKIQDIGAITGEEKLDNEKSYIQVSEFLWVDNQYVITMDDKNPEKIKTIKYKKNKNDAEEIEIKPDKAVYVRLGGTKRDVNKTTHRMHRVLTQCENASRAGYDLRMNGHLFGKIKPVWTFDYRDQSASENVTSLSKVVNATNYDIGSGYVGTGDFKYVAPPGDGVNVLLKDIIENLRWIATNSGIPIHWLSFPDLMSNRACYSEDTKTLTENGWKYFWEIEKSEKIACYNPNNNCIEYTIPKNLYIYEYSGEMYNFKTRRIDICVTPDHDMWVSNKNKNDFKKLKAKDIKQYIYNFRNGCNYENRKEINVFEVDEHDSFYKIRDSQPTKFKANDFYEFLGYYLSEGGCGIHFLKHRETYKHIIYIANKNKENIIKIRTCLNRMKLRFNEYIAKDGILRWCIHHSGLSKYLSINFGNNHYTKKIPFKFREVSINQLRLLFDALILGDGHYDKRKGRTGGIYYTTSVDLINAISDIAIRLGYSCCISEYQKNKPNRKLLYKLSFSTGIIQELKQHHINKIKYNGFVYCFSTEQGLFFTMRNGKITIQGNTADNISRMMEYATKKDRLIWEESFKELIEKAMVMAVENLGESNDILQGDFEIKLPLIDMDKVIDMIKELFVLVRANIIPESYLLNRLPGIDPEQIQVELDAQKEKAKLDEDEKIKKEVELRRLELRNNIDKNKKIEDNISSEKLDEE
jgi:hypothetical protein